MPSSVIGNPNRRFQVNFQTFMGAVGLEAMLAKDIGTPGTSVENKAVKNISLPSRPKRKLCHPAHQQGPFPLEVSLELFVSASL